MPCPTEEEKCLRRYPIKIVNVIYRDEIKVIDFGHLPNSLVGLIKGDRLDKAIKELEEERVLTLSLLSPEGNIYQINSDEVVRLYDSYPKEEEIDSPDVPYEEKKDEKVLVDDKEKEKK